MSDFCEGTCVIGKNWGNIAKRSDGTLYCTVCKKNYNFKISSPKKPLQKKHLKKQVSIREDKNKIVYL
jgi:hypothetical protein